MNTQISVTNLRNNPWIRPQATQGDEILLNESVRFARLVNQLSKELPPADKQPPNAIPLFQEGFLQDIPLLGNGTFTIVDFVMPAGCAGLLTHRSHFFTGSGFNEGSGVLTWQLKIGNGWAMNCGNMKLSIPDTESALVNTNGGYRVMTGQRITYQVIVNGAGGLDSTGVIAARLRGWYLPL